MSSPSKRARTRAALLVALQELLLESPDAAVTVPRMVARAEVAQGTFYNYFDSLPAAIDAVGELLIAEQFRTLLRVIEGASDAAEVVARSHRQTFMLFEERPDVGRLVFESGLPLDRIVLIRDAHKQLEANLQWGVDTGAFVIDNLQAACSMQIGAVVGSALDIYRGRLAPEDAVAVTGRLLRDLGVPKSRAERLARAPQEFEPWSPLPLTPEDER